MRGVGYASCHHGEILQGVFRDSTGNVCRGLVTLPMSRPATRASFVRQPDTPPEQLTVEPPDRVKALRATALAVQECVQVSLSRPCGGRLRLSGDIPIGLGMGSSTSDIVAAVRAVEASFGVHLPQTTIARLTVRAERACDPLMLEDRPLLFAQREGRVLEILGDALPAAIVVGCTTGQGQPVETLALPTGDHGGGVDTFERLRVVLRQAIATADVTLLGYVSTESARTNQRVLEKDEFSVLEDIAKQVGAAGMQVAHSGNVAGVLFDPQASHLRHRVRQCVRALTGQGIAVTRVFGSGHVRQGGRKCTTTSQIRSASQTWSASARALCACDSKR